jgi:hypothetical protein
MPVTIERVKPRKGLEERPIQTQRGFELVDRRIAGRRHHVENSTFVTTLAEAANLIEQGYAIRMGAKGVRSSLIAPKSLRILRS